MNNSHKKLIVIGGGAAGFFCAINAARLNSSLDVTILEKTNKILSKVKVSGGGRCNVTHACFDIREMSERYPRGKNFVKKTFHQFFTTDTIKWFEKRDVILKTEEDGRMFPVTDSSQTIINCLLREAEQFNVHVNINKEVKNILVDQGRFKLELSGNDHIDADFICIATGGYPKLEMFRWLTATGHTISDPVPSLFTFNLPKHPITALMGVSTEQARLKIEGTKLSEQGPVLITHWGLSGPVVLKISAWGAHELKDKNYDFKVHINWTSSMTEVEMKSFFQQARLISPTKKIFNQNLTGLPNRLWQFLLTEAGVIADLKFSELTTKIENTIIRKLIDYIVHVNGKTTFKEEFVTAGGINLSEVDANTMMSKNLPGVYFAGEVLNVDGITGGYNFQHAWTSGFIAAKAIANAQ